MDDQRPDEQIEDFIDALTSDDVDVVAEIYRGRHYRFCPMDSVFINKTGVIYCNSCDATIGSLNTYHLNDDEFIDPLTNRAVKAWRGFP